MKEQKLVEIVRSFTRKVNTGNYESFDVFCSQKMEVPEGEAVETSEALFQFCQDEVEKSANNYKLDHLPAPEQKKLGPKDFAIAKAEAPQKQAEQDKSEELGEEELPVVNREF